MQQARPPQIARKFNIFRRPSSNTSIESADSVPIVKKKYVMQKNEPANQQMSKNNLADSGLATKLKICDGQKLSYEVIRKDSKQKRAQFLDKYTHDPFMRKKFQKSIQKFSRSKSRQIVSDKGPSSVLLSQSRKIRPNHTYTTFREQIVQQSQKTAKLINNCKQLVDELKKNRLSEVVGSENGQSGRRFSHIVTRK